MVKFIARKLLIMCITVVLISLAVFYIITLPPGDFLTRYIGRLTAAGEAVDPVMIAQLREQYAGISAAIDELLEDGTIAEISQKYFNIDVSQK